MKIKSLKLENFRQHEDSYLEFNDGITVINGANGSGKSTILEAITWAIYGIEAARGNKDTIKFNKAKPRAKVKVELVFELDKDIFKVIRFLDKAEVYFGDNEAPIVTSQQEVTRYLVEKIGMTKNEFFNTYFTGQKELNFLKNQGSIERKKFISKVLNYDKVRDAQEASRLDKNALDKEIYGLKQGLQDVETLEKEKELITSRLKDVQNNFAAKQKKFSEISGSLAEIEPEWEKIKIIKENFDALTAENKHLLDKKEYFEKNIQNLSIQIKNLEEKNKKLSDLMKIEDEYRDLEKKIREQECLQEKDSLRQKYTLKIEGLQKEIDEKQTYLDEIIKSGTENKSKIENIQVVNEEINTINKQIQKLEADLTAQKREKEVLTSQKQREIEKIQKQLTLIQEKGEDGTCPTCERPLKNEFDKVTGNFKEQIEILSLEIVDLKQSSEKTSDKTNEIESLKKQKQLKEKEQEELKRIKSIYEHERERYKKIKTELGAYYSELEKTQSELFKLPEGFNIDLLKQLREQIIPLKKQYEEIISLKAELIGLDRIKKDYNEALITKNNVENRQNALNQELSGLNYSEQKYKELEKNYHEIRELFYKNREELIKTESEERNIIKELEQIKKIETSNSEKNEIIKQKQEEFDLLCELDRFYNQLWDRLNEEARPEISELAGKFLSDLTDNRYSILELNDKYDICLHDDGEIKPVISGGEEDIVNLCIRLAISQIIAHRSGKALSLLILDEIFGSLDENRRTNVINLLRNLTDSFEQVILITHIDDMKDDIDNIINLEFDSEEGCSRISMEKTENKEHALV
ncbi:MAG TPA: SMC family ATPase [Candidatus Gastranaerophilales bacterium]|nr:SMC family ATPase [Candidatus Gastranaerophilales bacterium]